MKDYLNKEAVACGAKIGCGGAVAALTFCFGGTITDVVKNGAMAAGVASVCTDIANKNPVGLAVDGAGAAVGVALGGPNIQTMAMGAGVSGVCASILSFRSSSPKRAVAELQRGESVTQSNGNVLRRRA